jgi:hypothetical protein
MTIKMIAMGAYGRGTYLADSWNRLDFFIVMSGALEYFLQVENLNLTAIRTIRVLRPLRAINRIPSKSAITVCTAPEGKGSTFRLQSAPFLSFFSSPPPERYANFGDAAAGHSAYARQRSSPLFFCILHIWHYWRSVVGR